jgi:hypothetical protein
MPFRDFVRFVAGAVGAEVDFARPRHGSFTVPFPHLYFARNDCGPRSYVYVYPRAN